MPLSKFHNGALDVAHILSRVEEDFPDALWLLGTSQESRGGDDKYHAVIQTRDFAQRLVPTYQGIQLQQKGWTSAADGATAEEALGKAYAIALENLR